MQSFNLKLDCEERPGLVHPIIKLESPLELDEFHRNYEEMEILGEGGAAVVKKCRHKQTNKLFACKIMRNYDIEKEQSSRQEFDLVKSI